MLVAQQTDVLLMSQAEQGALLKSGQSDKRPVETQRRFQNRREATANATQAPHLGRAKHLVFHVAAAELFLHCGARGGVQHLLFDLQTAEQGTIGWT